MTDTTSLEKILTVKFSNQKLLIEALTHRSYLNEHPETKTSNERLEFLGDSVLSLLTSTELFHRFADLPEGKLTSLRSNLVRAKTLSEIAAKLELGNFLLMSKGEEKSGGRNNPSLLANTFEAILGALFLDQGLDSAKSFLEKHLFPEIPQTITQEDVYDFKSRLQVMVQEKEKVSPVYKVAGQVGPDHDKTFTIAIYVKESLISKGTGKSKQAAEQEAARIALDKINR